MIVFASREVYYLRITSSHLTSSPSHHILSPPPKHRDGQKEMRSLQRLQACSPARTRHRPMSTQDRGRSGLHKALGRLQGRRTTIRTPRRPASMQVSHPQCQTRQDLRRGGRTLYQAHARSPVPEGRDWGIVFLQQGIRHHGLSHCRTLQSRTSQSRTPHSRIRQQAASDTANLVRAHEVPA